MGIAIKTPGITGWVYDATRGMVDVVTSDGSLYGWDLAQNAFTLSLHVGSVPDSVDISADGTYLLIGDRAQVADATAINGFDDILTRVNLQTQTVDTIKFPQVGYEGEVNQVAVAADGVALVTTQFEGSGWTPFRAFDLNAASPNFQIVQTLSQVRGSTSLYDSIDHRYVLITEDDISDGPLHVFDTTTDQVVSNTEFQAYNGGHSAINSSAGLIVNVLYNNINVYDSHLNLIRDLTSYTKTGSVVGATFSDDGHQLYLWEGANQRIDVIDTGSWAQVGTLNVTTPVGAAYNGAPWGRMAVVENGKLLVLDTGNGLELVPTGTANPGQVFNGGAGNDTLQGTAGDDTIDGGSGGANYLRGGAGDDVIGGGSGFDDINGNQGNDTAHGNAGDDWVVGGKDNDVLFGDDGDDIVWGNLGADTCDGGAGNDQVRGGQGDDSLTGGAGDDFISGDRGNDTESGGAGADIFHTFSGAGIDRVLDFHITEGDRVMVDPGTAFSVSQVGADTVIDMGNGDQMILVGVQMSTLTGSWIFGA